MQYNLTHRGQTIATFDTSTMDPTEADELRRFKGEYFSVVKAVPDRLPEIPGYSMMADVEREREVLARRWAERRGRKHSTRASSWL